MHRWRAKGLLSCSAWGWKRQQAQLPGPDEPGPRIWSRFRVVEKPLTKEKALFGTAVHSRGEAYLGGWRPQLCLAAVSTWLPVRPSRWWTCRVMQRPLSAGRHLPHRQAPFYPPSENCPEVSCLLLAKTCSRCRTDLKWSWPCTGVATVGWSAVPSPTR